MYKKILMLDLLVFIFAAVCFADIEKVQTLLISGDFSGAQIECQAILAGNLSPAAKEQALFYSGTINLKQKKLTEARSSFNQLLKDFPESSYLNRARLGIADAYTYEGNYSLAEKIYLELLERNDRQIAPATLISLMNLNIRQGNREKAQEYLNRLHTQCPLSMEASSIKNLPQAAESKPVTKEDVPEDKESSVEPFSVQVGAFADRNKAENLRQELIKKGEDAYVVLLEVSSGQSLYRVRIGRFSSQSDAEKLALKLTAQGYPTKVIP